MGTPPWGSVGAGIKDRQHLHLSVILHRAGGGRDHLPMEMGDKGVEKKREAKLKADLIDQSGGSRG